jgi:Zn finger protein HypA/HybF involved in hydrogenase expression
MNEPQEVVARVLYEPCPECDSHQVELKGGQSPHFDDTIYYLECQECLHQWDHG